MAKKIDGGTVVVDGKGNMKQLNKELDKTSKGFNTLDKNAQSSDRAMKGASKMSSNSTKNFSKLSQGITGGLVPAYATLAANLFAVDAVFRFLKDAADFRVLTQGQLAFAAATGVAYKSLAKDLQLATRGMINFRDAAQAGAIGRAAGLSAGQLNELSEAAFKVSIAIGRDVTDSFNRLVRGVTKAEPELLDELGIVLRLEEATTKYAASLGLNKNQLSIYQKSQAVVNEVLDQAERKFGKINAIMDPTANSIAQLGVAFEEVIDQIKLFLAPFAEGIATFAKENIDVITVAIIGFGAGIINSVIPSVHTLQEANDRQTAAHRAQLDELDAKYEILRQKKLALASTPISQQNFASAAGQAGLEIGGQVGEDLRAGKNLSGQQIGNLKSQLKRNVGAFKNMTDKQKKLFGDLLNDMKKGGGKMSKTAALQFEQMGLDYEIMTNKMSSGFSSFTHSVEKGLRTVMTVFSRIMLAVSVLSIAFIAIKSVMNFFSKDELARQKAYTEEVDKQVNSLKMFNEELDRMVEVRNRGLITDIGEQFKHTGEAFASANLDERLRGLMRLYEDRDVAPEKFAEAQNEVFMTLKMLSQLLEGENKQAFEQAASQVSRYGRVLEGTASTIRRVTTETLDLMAAVKLLENNEGELVKAQNRLVQSLPKTEFQDVLEILVANNKALEELTDQNQLYAAQLEKNNALQQMYNFLLAQELAHAKELTNMKIAQLGASVPGAGRQAEVLKVEQKRLDVSKMLNDLNKVSVTLMATGVDLESEKGKAMLQNLELSKEQLEVLIATFKFEEMRAGVAFQLFDKAYKGVETDLGQAIGKALRGEDGAFDKIGENLKKNITDGIGDIVSRRLMDQLLPNFGQKDVEEKIRDASSAMAQEVFEAIKKGGDAHATAIGTEIKEKGYEGKDSHAGTVGQVMQKQTLSLAETLGLVMDAEAELLKAKAEALDDEITTVRNQYERAKLLSTESGIDQHLGTLGPRDVNEFFKNRLSPAEQGEFNANVLRREQLVKDLADTNYSTPGSRDLMDRMVEERKGERVKHPLGHFIEITDRKSLRNALMAELQSLELAQFRRLEAVGMEGEVRYSGFAGGRDGKGVYDPRPANIGSAYAFDTSAGLELMKAELMKDIEMNKLDRDELADRLDQLIGLQTDYIDRAEVAETKADKLRADIENGDNPIDDKVPTTPGPTDPVSGTGGDGDGDGTGGEDEKKPGDKFIEGANFATKFAGAVGGMLALAGEDQKTAKLMAIAAKIQMTVAIYEQAKMAFEKAQAGGSFIKAFLGFGGRQGGIMSKHGRSYSEGGIAKGPSSGYGAILHGREAVIPLPNGRSIPVDLGKQSMATNNTNITVNIAEGTTSTVDTDGGAELGKVINMAVQNELEKQMRPGGILAG